MTFRPRVGVTNPPPRAAAARTVRKIALCGSHSASLRDAPWDDPSWEFWGHAASRAWYQRPMDRYFDLHPKACWTRNGKKGAYTKWLSQNTVPIYMQKRVSEVPASVEFPKGRLLLEYGDGRLYFTNHVAWMIALAMSEGVSTIGLFGVNYSSQGEYERQRGSCEYWLGRAAGAGVRVILPDQCSLLQEPALLYGYESHHEETGALKAEYTPKVWTPQETIRPVTPLEPGKLAEPPADLRAAIAEEAEDYTRPEWAIGPMTGRTDGSIGA